MTEIFSEMLTESCDNNAHAMKSRQKNVTEGVKKNAFFTVMKKASGGII
jgi:hypothetical protein